MIAQTIELPTISVKRSMEKTVVRIIEIAADSIMVGQCLRQLSDLENRNIRCQWSTPPAHMHSRQQGVTENCR